MKPINLLSLINAKRDLNEHTLNLYMENYGASLKKQEFEDLRLLMYEMYEHVSSLGLSNNFYVGFKIDQISKEFDLLRFGEGSIVNIELKNTSSVDKIEKQLKENKYYLSVLGLEILSFTYVSSENKLYFLNEEESLIETNMTNLISCLESQTLTKVNIQELFDPSQYLISPLNSPHRFILGEYYLTNHQESIKKDVIKEVGKSGFKSISIKGSAGTGKTLLAYDIAKYFNDTNEVLVLHCGSLNDGHRYLEEEHHWTIDTMKNHKNYDKSGYEIIIVDEAQRARQNQLETLYDEIKGLEITCIFSHDPKQCLSSFEIKSDMPGYINDTFSPICFSLTDKIRSNKEIGSFIKNFFDLSKRDGTQNYENINIQYFTESRYAKEIITHLSENEWKVINYTPSRFEKYPYDDYKIQLEDSAHEVIGQEFDKVVAIIDEHFYYTAEGKLSTKGWKSKPYYHPTKMLFQIMSRTRKELNLIIIKNETLLRQCLNIKKHNW